MRLAIPVVVALLLFAGLAQAAEVPTEKGDKAMVFMFHGFDDLSLGAYGGGFGMRYYITDGLAIRGALVFDMYSEKEEPSSNDPEGTPDYEYSESDIGIHLVVEKHLEGCGSSVSPYIGAGIGFNKYSAEEKCECYGTRDEDVDVWTEDATYMSFYGVAGFEWAFTDCLTLGGEYVLGFESWSSEEEIDYGYEGVDNWKSGEESATWIGFGTASVYLSVYW